MRACLLASVLLLALPAVVQAQFTFTTNDDGSLNVASSIPVTSDLIIPDTSGGLPITSIGTNAFENNQWVASVTIGNRVISIGDSAFYSCISLTNVIFGSNVISLGNSTFSGCDNLTTITIPNGVTNIGTLVFALDFNLLSVTIPNSVFSIEQAAFLQCNSLTSITIPNSVTNIGEVAFIGCNGLTTVTIPHSVSSLGQQAFSYCTNLASVYFIGNAPNSDGTTFAGNNDTTVYYLSGTTGWTTTYGDAQTMLWNPQAKKDANFGVHNNQFGFNIAGSSNIVVVVEASTNLTNPVWQPISTNTLNTSVGTNGTSYFSDPGWTNYPSRYYGFGFPQ
jgi:hypothetical protein